MATTTYEIPLSPSAQVFGVRLGASFYRLTLRWNAAAEAWMLSVANEAGTPLAENIPVVTGADLLEPLRYLGITGSLVVQTDNDPDAVPTLENLGTRGRIYFVVMD